MFRRLRRCVAIAALLWVCLWRADGARAEVVTIVRRIAPSTTPRCRRHEATSGLSRCPNAMIDYGPFAIEGAEEDRFPRVRGRARVVLNNAHLTTVAHALLFVGIMDLSALTSVLRACCWNDRCEYFICSELEVRQSRIRFLMREQNLQAQPAKTNRSKLPAGYGDFRRILSEPK